MAKDVDETAVDESTVGEVAKNVVETAVQTAVDQWIGDHLHNSPFSRDTDAWNHFKLGLPALILGIVKEVVQ